MYKKLSISVGVVALAVCLVQPVWAKAGARPTGLSVGVGAGWTFQTGSDVFSPNVVSARVRLNGGLTIEPLVTINYDSTASGMTGVGDDVTHAFTFGVGALARLPLLSRDKVDFELLAGAVLAIATNTNDPDGANNSVDTTILGLGAVWGVSVEYFVSHQWSWSFDAYNPLVSYVSSKTSPPGGIDFTSNALQIGAIFDPTVRLMTHVYF